MQANYMVQKKINLSTVKKVKPLQVPQSKVLRKRSDLCPNDGYADPPPQKDHLKKVVMNGAGCSEQNGYHRKLG